MRKFKKGFTLVELVIVIAVIAILASVLIPTFAGILNRAKESAKLQMATTARDELLSGNERYASIVDLEGYLIVVENSYYLVNENGTFTNYSSLEDIKNVSGKDYSIVSEQNSISIYEPIDFAQDTEDEIVFDSSVPSILMNDTIYPWSDAVDAGYITLDGTTLTKCNTEVEKIAIPDGITAIGISAFEHCGKLNYVKIADSVTQIANYAFQLTEALKEIVMPENLSSLGQAAFSGCRSLETITIKGNLTTIERDTFNSCYNLHTVNLPDTIQIIREYTFSYCYNLKIFNNLPSSLTTLGNCVFNGCYGLVEVTIPANVQSVGNNPFQYCYTLVSVINNSNYVNMSSYVPSNSELRIKTSGSSSYNTIEIVNNKYVTMTTPNNVVYLMGLYDRKTMLAYDLPENITKIYDYAFYYNMFLTAITIPSTVDYIGTNAFCYCYKLFQVRNLSSCFPTGFYSEHSTHINPQILTSAEAEFDGTMVVGEKYVTCSYANGKVYLIGTTDKNETDASDIPEGITNIYTYAFAQNLYLEKVVLPSTVNKIEENAFADCYSLKSVNIPSGVTKIEYCAFSDCTSLTTVTFDENSNLSVIGSSAFSSCYSLKNIVLPDSLERIESAAFIRCYNLLEINIPLNTYYIEREAFEVAGLKNVVFEIPYGWYYFGEPEEHECPMEEYEGDWENIMGGWYDEENDIEYVMYYTYPKTYLDMNDMETIIYYLTDLNYNVDFYMDN